jgi:hypothetical protein
MFFFEICDSATRRTKNKSLVFDDIVHKVLISVPVR